MTALERVGLIICTVEDQELYEDALRVRVLRGGVFVCKKRFLFSGIIETIIKEFCQSTAPRINFMM